MFGLNFQITTLSVRQKNGAAGLLQMPDLAAWYDPSDLASLFQDEAGTIAVTSDGDPVGAFHDKSGNGYHLTQPLNEARPTYRTDGTRHWIESDGSDDALTVASRLGLDADPDLTVSAALRPLSSNSSWEAVFGIGTGTGSLNGALGSAGISWRHINGATTFGSLPVGTDAVVSWARSSGDQYKDEKAYVDGIARTAAGSSTNLPSSTTEAFSMMSAGGTYSNMRWYGLVVLNSDNGADRWQAEAWLSTL